MLNCAKTLHILRVCVPMRIDIDEVAQLRWRIGIDVPDADEVIDIQIVLRSNLAQIWLKFALLSVLVCSLSELIKRALRAILCDKSVAFAQDADEVIGIEIEFRMQVKSSASTSTFRMQMKSSRSSSGCR